MAVPPLFKTALVWGLFMGVSSNVRYQVGQPAWQQRAKSLAPASLVLLHWYQVAWLQFNHCS